MKKYHFPIGTVLLTLSLLMVAACQSAPPGAACDSGTPMHPIAYNVRDYGAVGDGKALDSPAIDRAINAAAEAGGGMVFLPAGTYLSGSIHLKSNIELHIEAGATILGAPQAMNAYDAIEPWTGTAWQDGGHTYFHNSLIWGENLKNVSITGKGMINGGGLVSGDGNQGQLSGYAALPARYNIRNAAQPAGAGTGGGRGRGGAATATAPGGRGRGPGGEGAATATAPGGRGRGGNGGAGGDVGDPMRLGNKAIALKLCSDILIRDVTIFHGGHFAILVTGCDNMTVDNVTMDTNRDGIDIDCCRNTMVSNCRINSPGDDALCPKSSFALGRNVITENLTITNCQVSGWQEGTLLDGRMLPGRGNGRIKFGTEANGGFRNCTVSNCTFRGCKGLALEEVDGGILENITIDNITMMDTYLYAVYIRLGAHNRGPEVTHNGVLRNVIISNIIAMDISRGASTEGGIEIIGIPGTNVENLRLENIQLGFKGGGTAADAQNMPLDSEAAGQEYPEPRGVMPAYGVFARHVRGLEMSNIRLATEKADLRPPFMFVDVQNLELDNIKAQVAPGVVPIKYQDVKDVTIRNSPLLADYPPSAPSAQVTPTAAANP